MISTLQKLITAYELHDFSKLTLKDIYQLVEQRYLHRETASRLASECGYVS